MMKNEETNGMMTEGTVANGTVNFAVGQEIQVTPTGFKEYGVFCDCGNGYTGLIHISRISAKFVRNVADYFVVGQPTKVLVIAVDDATKKLSLSTREFDPEPKNQDSNQGSGFKGLEKNLDSWTKKDSNK